MTVARKKKASPAQLAARAKFAAMAKARSKKRSKGKAAKNPARRESSRFQVAVLRLGQVRFLAGVGLTNNREAAANYTTLDGARKSANQIRPYIGRAGIQKVAVVTANDSVSAIRGFMLGKAPPRRSNPVGPTQSEVAEAQERYEQFSGHRAGYGETVDLKVPRAGLVVGDLDGVLYTTVRDGQTERYVHKFRKSSKPLLVAGHDGRSLHVVGDRFEFTDRGIVDQ